MRDFCVLRLVLLLFLQLCYNSVTPSGPVPTLRDLSRPFGISCDAENTTFLKGRIGQPMAACSGETLVSQPCAVAFPFRG